MIVMPGLDPGIHQAERAAERPPLLAAEPQPVITRIEKSNQPLAPPSDTYFGQSMLDGLSTNSTSLSIILAVAGLLGGGLLSWVITFAYFKKAQSRKLLCYASRSTSYLGYNGGDFHDLSVRYGEKQLKNPFRYTLYVWNCGNVTINRADISNIDPLAFGRNDIEILETNPIWTTRESTNPKLMLDASKTRLTFEFDFLDPNDGFAVQFLADKADSKSWWQTNLQCYGTIKGLSRSPRQVEAKFTETRWWSLPLGLVAIAFLGFCTLAMGYDSWLSGLSVHGLVRLFAAVIFGLITVGATVATFQDRGRSSSEVIPSLLRRSEHGPPEIEPFPAHVLLQIGNKP
jgi:hypothetical protein